MVVFFFNLIKSIKSNTYKSYVETFSKNDILSFSSLFIFLDIFIIRMGKFFIILFENKIVNLYIKNNIIRFLSNIWRNRTLLQEIKEALVECFLILIFSPRQFSLYSILIFGSFIIAKTIYQIWLQNLIINSEIQKNFHWKKYSIFIFYLIGIYHMELIVSKICLSFYRRRVVNIIVGTELLFFSSFLKGIIINHLFSFVNLFFLNNNWKFQKACEQYLKIFISFLSNFSFIFSTNNLFFSKKGFFKFYLIKRFSQSLKEFFQNLEEFVRFRKTQVFIENILKYPSQEEIDNLNDPICIICRDDMTTTLAKILPCKHILHITCLQDWLKRQFGCPICMSPISSTFLKMEKQNLRNSILSLKEPKINSIAISTGFKQYIHDPFFEKKNYLKKANLPSLFPEFDNLFFRNQNISYKQNLKNKEIYFLELFSEFTEKNIYNFGFIEMDQEYFHFFWAEKNYYKFKQKINFQNKKFNETLNLKRKEFFQCKF